MKVIYVIGGDKNNIKIAPCKINQHNLDVLEYIKGEKYPEVEVGKYVYAVREVQSQESRQYVRIKLLVDHDVTWDDWYTTLQCLCMKKGENYLKLCNYDFAEPLWFMWLDQITWQMALTNDSCEVHKRCSGIYLGMNYKRCADGSECSEHKKQGNAIHF